MSGTFVRREEVPALFQAPNKLGECAGMSRYFGLGKRRFVILADRSTDTPGRRGLSVAVHHGSVGAGPAVAWETGLNSSYSVPSTTVSLSSILVAAAGR